MRDFFVVYEDKPVCKTSELGYTARLASTTPPLPCAEAEQTRNSILDAALTLFDEQGYTQTTLSSIARQAGVTRGAIYWHFENKDEILIALAQAQFHDLMQQNADAVRRPNSWETICDNLITFFQTLIHHPARLRFFRVFNQHGCTQPLAQLHRDYKLIWQQQCREIVERGKAEGRFRTDTDPDYLFFHMGVIFRGLVEMCLEEPDNPSLAAYIERALKNTTAMLQTL